MRKLKHLSLQSAAATLTGKKREMVLRGQENYQHAFDIEQNCKRDIEQLAAKLGTVAETVNFLFNRNSLVTDDISFSLLS